MTGYAEEHGIKALCFDIDGTFYPKWQMDVRLAAASLPHLPFALRYNSMRQRLRRETGFGESDTLSLIELQKKEAGILGMEASSFIEKEERVFRKPWRRLFSSIVPFPGLREVLEEAQRRGYMLAALSDFPTEGKLEALGIADLFGYVSSTEDYGALKPSVTPFRSMLDKLGVSPCEALYTGDSRSKDIDGAKNVGMHTALISRSVRVYSNADIIFFSWKEFGKVVLGV